jgi:PKD repeat protein
MSDDAFNSGTDQLWLYELAVDWTTLSASTFNRVQQLDVSPFDSNFGNDWTNIKQLGTTQELDAIPQVIMNVPQYRNFGTYQTIVCCHSVDVDKTDHAGIRWYELRKTPPSTTWEVRQQGTFAPDIHSRWMGSIMLNGKNEIGVGYSVSGSTLYPGIRYCGQTDIEYNNASGILDLPEGIILNGTASQTGTERWGDYSQMSVDPVNDSIFWFTSEYVGAGIRRTKIASFEVERVPPVAFITANDTLPCILTGTVTLTSEATGSPTQYAWSIMPETYSYVNGSDSSTHNPQVIFNAYGNYSVSLTVTNIVGSTTTTKTDYIHVNEANANFTMNSATVVEDNFISFTDASTCSPAAWAWDFGDGASPRTANTQGPHSVSYSTAGLKTISLIVNGNTAGEKTRNISVIGADISMSSATVAACSGTFYDPGGPAANYANNLDYTMLFKPGYPGGKLDFEFISFNIESQTTCTKDFLKIYDGESISSTLIGTYCGTSSPGIIRATNSAGALLFVFHSNSTTTQPGWAATVSCSGVNALNPASITATAASSTQINLAWTKNTLNNDVLLAWSPDEIFGVPSSGTTYTAGDLIPGGGTILSKGSVTTFNHTGLNPSTVYYYKAFSVDAALKYSSGITANDSTLIVTSLYDYKTGIKGLNIFPNPAKGLFSLVVDKVKYPEIKVIITNVNGVPVISRECKGESEYEFDLSKSPEGTYFVKIITDKELLVTKLVIIK